MKMIDKLLNKVESFTTKYFINSLEHEMHGKIVKIDEIPYLEYLIKVQLLLSSEYISSDMLSFLQSDAVDTLELKDNTHIYLVLKK